MRLSPLPALQTSISTFRPSSALGAPFALGVVGLACGGAPAPAPALAPEPPAQPAPGPADDLRPAAPGPEASLPKTCANGPSPDVCAPPPNFAERICQKPHQNVALALFDPATPFTRLYLRGRLDELHGGEEVLVMRFHAPQKGGMVVGTNTGTYDVLRWDGTCSQGVESEAFTRNRPARITTARIQWHRIGSRAQDALVSGSTTVKEAHARRGKECKGAITGDVSAACVKADAALGAAVVETIRSGARLPEPEDPL